MTTATLYGSGRVSWQRARTLLADAACAWTDLDGAHLDPAPDTAPTGASHLWAWTSTWCARLRFDDDAVYLGVLSIAEPPDATLGVGETVHVTARPGLQLWAPGDLQAGPIPPDTRDFAWELLEVTGEQPLSFVRAVSRTAAADSV